MYKKELLADFMNEASKNNEISASHISLYSAILCLLNKKQDLVSLQVTRKKLMLLSKLASTATYHKCMKDLVKFKFLNYSPSYHPKLGSQITLK